MCRIILTGPSRVSIGGKGSSVEGDAELSLGWQEPLVTLLSMNEIFASALQHHRSLNYCEAEFSSEAAIPQEYPQGEASGCQAGFHGQIIHQPHCS